MALGPCIAERRRGAVRIHRGTLSDGRCACVKLLGPSATDLDRTRLRHERLVLGKLAGIAGVAQRIESPELPEDVLITEWAWGPDLYDWERRGEMSDSARELLSGSLREVVAAASARGVTHGDLSASNIALGRDGRAVVIDWEHASVNEPALTAGPDQVTEE